MIVLIERNERVISLSVEGRILTIESHVSEKLYKRLAKLAQLKKLGDLEKEARDLLGLPPVEKKKRVVEVKPTADELINKLYKMKAKDIITTMKRVHGVSIKLNVKNKKGIVKKAVEFLQANS